MCKSKVGHVWKVMPKVLCHWENCSGMAFSRHTFGLGLQLCVPSMETLGFFDILCTIFFIISQTKLSSDVGLVVSCGQNIAEVVLMWRFGRRLKAQPSTQTRKNQGNRQAYKIKKTKIMYFDLGISPFTRFFAGFAVRNYFTCHFIFGVP